MMKLSVPRLLNNTRMLAVAMVTNYIVQSVKAINVSIVMTCLDKLGYSRNVKQNS